MKNLFYIIAFVFSMVFWACTDGQERMHQSPQEILQENKLLDSFSEKVIRFIPETYAEKTTDTIFDNGYIVKVKMYTDMDNHITVKLDDETVNYRDYNLDIEVIKDDESILYLTINKSHQIHEQLRAGVDLDEYYLRDFWIAKDNKYHKNIPGIYFEYYSPTSKDSIIQEILPYQEYDVKYMTSVITN
ncbi:hypothetical protein C1T31_12415 [Hanstruepera neustonica]|uniref:Uncharacterized protein n=1 Tax=Hanstruepera neustonica TaxID=1445657 RepID=A0A2K1DWD5_9FLAO|nr:hypothetical protein [Hanstruepera neustonica]PNQ72345.1 hypothetical protein C1T31_12415 [Hanstruepera neustonica]